MRENRTCGSEGGEAQSLPYPYPGGHRAFGRLAALASCQVQLGAPPCAQAALLAVA